MERCGLDGEKLVECADDPLIGRDVDRYHVLEQLGHGAMARVYRAKHKFLGTESALKILLGQIAIDRTLAERFRREAQAVSRIKHKNVVAVTDFGVTDFGVTFLAMELLRGKSLAKLLKEEGSLAPRRAARIARQIALGLTAAAKLGFVHRDLKPGNVMMVEEDGEELAKVLDFGLVRLDDNDDVTKLTRSGQVFGTPAYMAPEQIEGVEVGPKADLYALGVMLYEMLTGAPPFVGNLQLVLALHLTEVPRPIPEHGALGEVAIHLLAKRPSERPSDADEVARCLEPLEKKASERRAPKSKTAEVYQSSPFVEIQRTVPDANAPIAETPEAIQSLASITQSLAAKNKSRTWIPALVLGPAIVCAAVGARYAYQHSSRSEPTPPPAIIAPIEPSKPPPPSEEHDVIPPGPATEKPAPSPPAHASKSARSVEHVEHEHVAPSGLFRTLDHELQVALDQRGLTLADITSMEPDRARMWSSWRSSGTPPSPQLARAFFDALKGAAKSFSIQKPWLHQKLARIEGALAALPSGARRTSLEGDVKAASADVDRASSPAELTRASVRVAQLDRKLGRPR
jgi:serine/threonine-protein kinase